MFANFIFPFSTANLTFEEENIASRKLLEKLQFEHFEKKTILNTATETLFLSNHTKKLLMLLIDRSRIGVFEAIGHKYLELTYKYVKIEVVQLKSAFALTDEQEKQIIEQLKKRTGANEIRLITTIDENLLSGMIIQIGSKVIDLSLRDRLKKLATQLETTIF